MATTKYYGTGSRASYVARVALVPGHATITHNNSDNDEYLGSEQLTVDLRQTLIANV